MRERREKGSYGIQNENSKIPVLILSSQLCLYPPFPHIQNELETIKLIFKKPPP